MIAALIIAVFIATFIVAALAVIIAASLRPNILVEAERSEVLLPEEAPLSTMPVWRRILTRFDVARLLKQRIDEAGLGWTVGRVSLSMLLLAAVSFALCLNVSWLPPGAPFIAAWIGGSIPYWVIAKRRRRRLQAMEQQFPDALESLSRAMRAGHALSSGIALLSAELPAPLGPEFRKMGEEHRLGLSWTVVLHSFSERVPVLEARLLAAALQMHTRTGGKLTEVLERLGENVRESVALRGEVRAISAQGRLTGSILTALPFIIAGMMYYTNPAYMGILFSDPRGRMMVWGALGCVVAGHFAIGRIVDIQAPQ